MATDRDTAALIAEYELYAGGGRVPPAVATVIDEINVDQDLTSVGMFTITLHATEREQERIPVIDGDLFRPGNEIKIKLGYGSTLETMMVGEITALSPEYSNNGAVVFRVRGYERLYRLGFGRKSRAFRNMTDSDIAAQIAQDWRLTPQVDATAEVHPYILQRNQTDREFLTARARRLRYEVRVEDRSLYFSKAKEDASKIVTLTYGDNLVEFFPELSTLGQTSTVQVRGWSVKEKKAVVGQAGTSDTIATMGGRNTGGQVAADIVGETPRILSGENVASPSEAETLARAALNRAATAFITGEGSCVGHPDIKAGTVVEVKGVGARFQGLYYVAACTHSIGPRGYHTFFRVRRSAV